MSLSIKGPRTGLWSLPCDLGLGQGHISMHNTHRDYQRTWSCDWKLHFSRISTLPVWHGAQNWWLIMIVWNLVSLSEPNYKFLSQKAIARLQNFAECRYYRTYKGPYFLIAWDYHNQPSVLSSTPKWQRRQT